MAAEQPHEPAFSPAPPQFLHSHSRAAFTPWEISRASENVAGFFFFVLFLSLFCVARFCRELGGGGGPVAGATGDGGIQPGPAPGLGQGLL